MFFNPSQAFLDSRCTNKNKMAFTGKVVIVTGASAGIGAATAVAYAKQGAKLVLGGRNEENLKKTAKLCEEQGVQNENILLVLGDLTNEEVCNTLVDKTIDKFGCLDVVVNNAGGSAVGTLETTTLNDVDLMFNSHVKSVFSITKRAIPHLKKSKGNIVNISSVAAERPASTILPYSIAKAAQNQLTKCLAQDVGPSGVRVNCIMPGVIETDIFIGPGGIIEGRPEIQDKFFEENGKAHALGRCGQVKEVADVILFVSSDAASFMTGAEILVDGGLSGKNAF